VSKGMFTELMEAADKKPEEPKVPQPRVNKPSQPKDPRPQLPPEIENVSRVGYVSHSFRLTTSEKEWLDSFCFQLSAQLDRKVTHNNLVRVLLRIADTTMKTRPDGNELLDRLLQIKD
jgi:hypothetical protein